MTVPRLLLALSVVGYCGLLCHCGPFEDALFNLSPTLQKIHVNGGDRIGQDNFIISPVGMAVALGQLATAANNPLKSAVFELLQQDTDESLHGFLHKLLISLLPPAPQNPNETFALQIATALFAEQSIELDPTFINTLHQYYDSPVVKLPLSENFTTSQNVVDFWVMNKTNGLIKSFPIDPSTVALIANAVYFNGDWVEPFWSMVTRPGVFTVSPTENITVDYMLTQMDTIYAHDTTDLNCAMIRMPYISEHRNASMYLLLPNEFNLKELLEKLNANTFKALLDKAKFATVNVRMTKIDLDAEIKLKKYLRIIANKNAENERRRALFNLKNITTNNKNMFLSEILQKTVLVINEKGTTAASVAASTINYDGFSKNFSVTRPFIAIVRDDTTESTLFWATIVHPTQSVRINPQLPHNIRRTHETVDQ